MNIAVSALKFVCSPGVRFRDVIIVDLGLGLRRPDGNMIWRDQPRSLNGWLLSGMMVSRRNRMPACEMPAMPSPGLNRQLSSACPVFENSSPRSASFFLRHRPSSNSLRVTFIRHHKISPKASCHIVPDTISNLIPSYIPSFSAHSKHIYIAGANPYMPFPLSVQPASAPCFSGAHNPVQSYVQRRQSSITSRAMD
jgi:hypothetical protein